MKKKEFQEKTVEKAIAEACKHFGVESKKELEIEIVTKGSTGLFGLGGRPAIIRAVPKVLPSTRVEKKDNGGEAAQESGTLLSEFEGHQEKVQENRDQERAPEDDNRMPQQESCQQRQPKGAGQEPDPQEYQRHVLTAVDITNEILEKSGLDGRAQLGELHGKPVVNISGEDLSLIIGKEGQTIDALEYIVNLALKRRSDLNLRITIDGSGYRQRQDEILKEQAIQAAGNAKNGRSVTMQPMSARERRLVHITLKNQPGVKTHSTGQGRFKKVVITPLKKRGRRSSRNHRSNNPDRKES